ncbi:MAG: hypothetical protein RRA45_02805 [Saccharolobus sp.]|jgi:hypothetical protein|uniref:hypothetical protein n=1 Tax=Saccharolobus sp. TaxID=2100761 RepID=UPI0028CD48FD|nr:hypothetical protein [Saccharolobus sp.]MDT7861136.1 hypothetical protein [Saccharolobus sp.]
MNLAEYYKLDYLKINDVINLYTIKKVKEAEIVNGIQDLESILPEDSADLIIIKSKDESYVNTKLVANFQFSEPLYVSAIGLPQQITNESVSLLKINVNANNVIGGSLIKKDLPFIVLFTNNGTKIISISDINPPTPERKQPKSIKKRKRKSKKRAKKSNSKPKTKSKSSRKN